MTVVIPQGRGPPGDGRRGNDDNGEADDIPEVIGEDDGEAENAGEEVLQGNLMGTSRHEEFEVLREGDEPHEEMETHRSLPGYQFSLRNKQTGIYQK